MFPSLLYIITSLRLPWFICFVILSIVSNFYKPGWPFLYWTLFFVQYLCTSLIFYLSLHILAGSLLIPCGCTQPPSPGPWLGLLHSLGGLPICLSSGLVEVGIKSLWSHVKRFLTCFCICPSVIFVLTCLCLITNWYFVLHSVLELGYILVGPNNPLRKPSLVKHVGIEHSSVTTYFPATYNMKPVYASQTIFNWSLCLSFFINKEIIFFIYLLFMYQLF